MQSTVIGLIAVVLAAAPAPRQIAKLEEGRHVVALDSRGRQLATSVSDELTVWNLATGKAIRSTSFDVDVSALSFSPDGTKLAIGAGHIGGEQAILEAVVWSLKSGDQVTSASIMLEELSAVGFSPSGALLAMSSSEGTDLIDAKSGVHLLHFDAEEVAISPDDRWLAAAEKGSIRLQALPSGKPLAGLDSGGRELDEVAISPDGKLILGWRSGEASVLVWERGSTKLIRTLECGCALAEARVEPAGKTLLAVGQEGEIERWSLGSGKLVARLALGPGLSAVSADGRRAALVSSDGRLLVFELPKP